MPQLEHEFLTDQRADRLMMIGNIDGKITSRIRKREVRKQKGHSTRQSKIQKENDDSVEPESYSDLDSDECPDADQIVCPQNSSQTNTNVQTRLNISTFARTCDRYGISDRPAASLASALLMDISMNGDDEFTSTATTKIKSDVKERKSAARY